VSGQARVGNEQIADRLERLTVGQFAHVTTLTVPMLRRYDRAGLLRPAFRDADTGYRYYSWRQLYRAETIRMLRSLDVPMGDIAAALENADSVDLERIVEHQRQHIEERIQCDRHTVLRLECMLAHGSPLVNLRCRLQEVAAQPVASLRYETTLARAGESEAIALKILHDFLAERGIAVTGRELVVSHRLPLEAGRQSLGDQYVMEACLPVAAAPVGEGRVKGVVLSACEAATALLRGPWDDIRHAHWAVLAWLLDQGYVPAGPARQVYLVDDSDISDPRGYVTEIMRPVKSANGCSMSAR
jgi:DNA-binding transcriptional MerR regulator